MVLLAYVVAEIVAQTIGCAYKLDGVVCRLFVSVRVHDNLFVPICPSGHFSIFVGPKVSRVARNFN